MHKHLFLVSTWCRPATGAGVISSVAHMTCALSALSGNPRLTNFWILWQVCVRYLYGGGKVINVARTFATSLPLNFVQLRYSWFHDHDSSVFTKYLVLNSINSLSSCSLSSGAKNTFHQRKEDFFKIHRFHLVSHSIDLDAADACPLFYTVMLVVN